MTELQSKFDIENRDSFVFAYIKGYKKSGYRLFFAAHHLLVDTVSWRILVEHLREIHTHLLHESDPNYFIDRWLKEVKLTSYRQWCAVVNGYIAKHNDQLNYWNEIISDLNLVRPILSDHISVPFDSDISLNHSSFYIIMCPEI